MYIMCYARRYESDGLNLRFVPTFGVIPLPG